MSHVGLSLPLSTNMAPTRSRARQSNPKAKTKKEVSKIVAKEEDDESKPGCIYIGHIPHGFFEEEMGSYFSQFGHVLGVKLCRSKKNGNSKGYGFVKFRYAAVAKTVAETCHNYLFFNKLLKCEYKPLSDVHKATFRTYSWTPKTLPKRQVNRAKTEAKLKERMKKSISKAQKKIQHLKEAGIDVDLQDIVDLPVRTKTQSASSVKVSQNTKENESTLEPSSTKENESTPEPSRKLKKLSDSPTVVKSPATDSAKKTQLNEKNALQSPKLGRPQRKAKKIIK